MDKATINRPSKPLLMGFVNNYNNIDPFNVLMFRQLLKLAALSLILIFSSSSVDVLASPKNQVIHTDLVLPDLNRLNQRQLNKLARSNGISPRLVANYRQSKNGIWVLLRDGSEINFRQKTKQVDIEFTNKTSNTSGTQNVIKGFGDHFNADLNKVNTPNEKTLIATFTPKNPVISKPILPNNPIYNPKTVNPKLPTSQPKKPVNTTQKISEPSSPPTNSIAEVVPPEPKKTQTNNNVVSSPDITNTKVDVDTRITSEPIVKSVSSIVNEPQRSAISQPIIGQDNNLTVPTTSLNLGGLGATPPSSPQLPQQPLFNARLADPTEITDADSSGTQTVRVTKIAYVDVAAVSTRNTNMFGTIGNGIGMKLGQCEEMDGCAPNLDKNSIDELEQKLLSDLEVLEELEAKKSSSHIKRKKQALLYKVSALKQHKEQLKLLESQEIQNQVAMEELSKPDVIPSSEFPLRQSVASSPVVEAVDFDVSQFDTSIFEDFQTEIADDL